MSPLHGVSQLSLPLKHTPNSNTPNLNLRAGAGSERGAGSALETAAVSAMPARVPRHSDGDAPRGSPGGAVDGAGAGAGADERLCSAGEVVLSREHVLALLHSANDDRSLSFVSLLQQALPAPEKIADEGDENELITLEVPLSPLQALTTESLMPAEHARAAAGRSVPAQLPAAVPRGLASVTPDQAEPNLNRSPRHAAATKGAIDPLATWAAGSRQTPTSSLLASASAGSSSPAGARVNLGAALNSAREDQMVTREEERGLVRLLKKTSPLRTTQMQMQMRAPLRAPAADPADPLSSESEEEKVAAPRSDRSLISRSFPAHFPLISRSFHFRALDISVWLPQL